jgi:H+/Cl- antiporter ClcA
MDLEKRRGYSEDYSFAPWIISGVIIGLVGGAMFGNMTAGVLIGGGIGVVIGAFFWYRNKEEYE